MKYETTFETRIFKCLKENSGDRMTAVEIAKWIVKEYPEYAEEKKKNSKNINDDFELVRQVRGEVTAYYNYEIKGKNNKIKTIEVKPRKYYYTESTDEAEVEQIEEETKESSPDTNSGHLTERQLYPLLTQFLSSEGIVSKRINESTSTNNRGINGNKWLHPDLVGLQDLSQNWQDGMKECVRAYSDKITKLWSFEVKKFINSSNVREVFFQTVSNSSWANFGYLVASEISGSATLKELRILSGLHGIGVIELDVENPTESQIIIPAKEKIDVDWDTVDRLFENNDFKEYINLVSNLYLPGKLKLYEWDTGSVEE